MKNNNTKKLLKNIEYTESLFNKHYKSCKIYHKRLIFLYKKLNKCLSSK
jgi:hypothetical protein